MVNVGNWEALDASPFVLRALRYGIMDKPATPFTGEGTMARELPPTQEDSTFGQVDLAKGSSFCEMSSWGSTEKGQRW